MKIREQHFFQGKGTGFTLLEILTATLMFSIIMGALYSVFYGALRMREKAYRTFERELPRAYVNSIIRKDLMSLMPSGGLFSGALIGESEEVNGVHRDSIEFYTSSGIVTDASPWGDIRHVKYSLAAPEETTENNIHQSPSLAATDLVRTVTDNLLQSEEETPRRECLLQGVRSLEIGYFDGEYWQDSWDGTTQTEETVKAVSMLISFDPDSAKESQVPLPVRIVVPLTVETSSTDASPGSTQSQQGTPSGSEAGGSPANAGDASGGEPAEAGPGGGGGPR